MHKHKITSTLNAHKHTMESFNRKTWSFKNVHESFDHGTLSVSPHKRYLITFQKKQLLGKYLGIISMQRTVPTPTELRENEYISFRVFLNENNADDIGR